jgi:hypothetical protein
MPRTNPDNQLDKAKDYLNRAYGARADYFLKLAQAHALVDIAESLRTLREESDNG